MITLGKVLQLLNNEIEKGDGFSESAMAGVESIVSILVEQDEALEDYFDGHTVVDDWLQIGDETPREGEVVVVTRYDDFYSDGPTNGFVAKYRTDSRVDGWETILEDGQKWVKPGYADDYWRRI